VSRAPLIGVVAAMLALAACGGGSGGDTSSGPAAASTQTVVSTAAGAATPVQAAFDPQTIYQREGPGVVTVISVFAGGGGVAGLPGGDGGSSLGSGFVISEQDGEVATNAHVVTSGESLQRAREVYVEFGDGNQVPAKIVGTDPNADVGLLKIDPTGLDLRALPFAQTKDVTVGEPVAAIGSPYGEPQSLSVGVISALDRSIQSLTGFAISGALQTDAAINHGNSGGPLLDAEGRVLGINSQIKSGTGEGTGVGFAVDADTVRHSLDGLRRDGKVDYAFLGVASQSVYPQLAEHFRLGIDHGAWVQSVTRGGPADQAGIRGGSGPPRTFQAQQYRTGGDVITAIDGQDVARDSDLGRLLAFHAPGEKVPVTVVRSGDEKTLTVTLGKRPPAAGP
jgi:2-alkenal reductase